MTTMEPALELTSDFSFGPDFSEFSESDERDFSSDPLTFLRSIISI
jgi:hypothetical protein